jgi:hypothetical protein
LLGRFWKSEARFIVVVPWVIGCFGNTNWHLGRGVFGPPGISQPPVSLLCDLFGGGNGHRRLDWLVWLERELQPHFKDIIRENKTGFHESFSDRRSTLVDALKIRIVKSENSVARSACLMTPSWFRLSA